MKDLCQRYVAGDIIFSAISSERFRNKNIESDVTCRRMGNRTFTSIVYRFSPCTNYLYNIASSATQSNSVYVRVLQISIVLVDSVSKSLRQNFFFSRERPLSARGIKCYISRQKWIQTETRLNSSKTKTIFRPFSLS